MLYGVVHIRNMWNNGAVLQPEVLCVKLNYDRKSKDPTYFIQQGIRNGKKVTITRFLTYGRILDPHSKAGTYDRLDTYYGMESTFDYHHILRHMDVLVDNFDAYMEHLFVNSNSVVKRNTSVCYYDCTNYFFECEHEDEAYVDPVTGEVFRGLRK